MSCAICSRKDASDINGQLLEGAKIRDIAKLVGKSHSLVHHHLRNHVRARLLKPWDYKNLAHKPSLVDRLNEIEKTTKEILESALTNEDHKVALLAVKEIVRILEFEAKLTGELTQQAVMIDNRSFTLSIDPNNAAAVKARIIELQDKFKEIP